MREGIRIKNVSFSYEKNKPILKDISLIAEKGDFVGITGVNGSGKTTLTYLFNGLIPHLIRGYLKGEVIVDGISTSSKNVIFFAQKVGMVFQNPDFSLFNLTVAEEIGFALKNLHLGDTSKRIKRALNYVGLSDFIDRDPQTLSFGEKQKICLSCVLAIDSDYIVLDEPSAMLDYKSSLEIYRILRQLNTKKKTIIVVEHDTDLLWRFTRKVFILDKGETKAFGKTRDILSQKELLNFLGIKLPNYAYGKD